MISSIFENDEAWEKALAEIASYGEKMAAFKGHLGENPRNLLEALKTLENADSILIGGMDRGISYDKLINKINSLPNLKVICMNEVGKKIYDQINNEKYLIDDMIEVVNKAKEITKKICIMSPAAPSYGYFKNFEDRGTQFKNAVLNK